MNRGRIEALDALRGLAVVLMVLHHLLYDLTVLMGFPGWLYSNPVFDVLQFIFVSVFILLAGVSSRFSRNNLLRGTRVMAVAVAITVATWIIKMPILFGILHFMGVSMVFYALTHTFWERIPLKRALIIFASLFVISWAATVYISVESNWMYPLGLGGTLSSYDYYPILPWIFMFLIGTALGKPIKDGEFPEKLYEFKAPKLAFIGRRALVIYIAHQPVIYGLLWLARKFL
jgi:uncharacterized membrane protein